MSELATPRETVDSITVLHVDDESDLLDLAATMLEREREAIDVVTETSAPDGVERLRTESVDCVVSDYDMPEVDGLEFLERVREDHPDLPFILYTGRGSEDIASEAISKGVSEYLQKGTGREQYVMLANRIVNAVKRYRAKIALREREESLARAQKIANLGNWDWDIVDDRLYWSDQIYRIFGTDPQSFDETYDAFLEFVHPDDRDLVQGAVRDALAGEAIYSIDHRIVRTDGEVRIVHEEAEVIRDDSGDPIAMNGTVQEVSERRRRELDLRTYREAVARAYHPICWTDAEGAIQYVNGAFESVIGHEEECVIGRDVEWLLGREHDDAVAADLWETVENGGTWEDFVPVPTDDGERERTGVTVTPIFVDQVVQRLVASIDLAAPWEDRGDSGIPDE